MSENIETPSVLKADKTSWADNIAATIRSIIPKSPKRLYLLIDIIFGEIKSRHGYDEISRSFLSSVFFPGPSKDAVEKIFRRKFRCNPEVNLDFTNYDHFLSMFLETITGMVLRDPESLYKPVYLEHLPEMLAAISPEERDLVYHKGTMLYYGRSARNSKKSKQTEVATTQESLNNEIVEGIETEVPPIVTQNEPEPELEFIPEPVTVNDPEKPSEVRLNLKYPDVDTSVPPESIPTPKTADFSVYRNQK